MQETEETLHASSVQHSTTSQESALQLESLQLQVEQLQDQRDQLLKKLGRVSQEHQSQLAAVENLTMALEGFQRERENDARLAERDFAARAARAEERHERARQEAAALEEKLERANEGLEAAARLSEQLEAKSAVIAALRQEVRAREELLGKAREELTAASASGAGKVDRGLVKNLVVGYVAADEGKRRDVLRIVATVLDFNKEERLRTGLDGEGAGSASWLRGMFGPGLQRQQQMERAAANAGLDKSLAQAFVQFLESESSPKAKKGGEGQQEDGVGRAGSSSAAAVPRLPAADLAEEEVRRAQVIVTLGDLSIYCDW